MICQEIGNRTILARDCYLNGFLAFLENKSLHVKMGLPDCLTLLAKRIELHQDLVEIFVRSRLLQITAIDQPEECAYQI